MQESGVPILNKEKHSKTQNHREMKKMKKVVCALMVLIVLLIVSVSSAEEETMFYQTEKGRYQYRILQDGTAMIVAYQGSAATLVIPAEFDGIKVSCIWR